MPKYFFWLNRCLNLWLIGHIFTTIESRDVSSVNNFVFDNKSSDKSLMYIL